MEIAKRSQQIADTPVWKHIGMEIKKSIPGYSEVELKITQQLLQIHGSVHGGIQATLIDAAVGTALTPMLEDHEAASTVELKTNFLRPGMGEKLICKGSIKHKGRNLVLGEAEIINDMGKLIASGTATYMISRK
jgi:uncharacterized protein (TIGR00369 family)